MWSRETLGFLVLAMSMLFIFSYMHFPYAAHVGEVILKSVPRKSVVTADIRSIHVSDAVFVTAADFTHFEESKRNMASAQKNIPPGHRILYYDIGLNKQQRQQVQKWCRVTYVKFEWCKYPSHVHNNLREYAWKALVVQEVLQDHQEVVWFDASIRFKCPNFIKQIRPTLRKSGIALVTHTIHSNYEVTHPAMYKYIPSNIKLLQTTRQYESGLYAILKTPLMQEKIMKPFVKCSLEEDCIAPAGSKLHCDFRNGSFTPYVKCHRYDQSALNLLLTNLFKGDTGPWLAKGVCVSVKRRTPPDSKLQLCN